MKKSYTFKVMSVFLVCVMLISIIAVTPAAAVTPNYSANATWEADPDGIFRIYDAEDLLAFASKAAGNSYYAGKTVKLMTDIDLNPGWDSDTKTRAANVWIPPAAFQGTLDGGGYTVRGICVVEKDQNNTGIFREVKEGVNILNIRIANSYIESIVNVASPAYQENFAVTGTFFGTCNAPTTRPQFKNIYIGEDVHIVANTGGVGGFGARYWSGQGIDYTDCAFAGTITSTNSYLSATVGGIMGTERTINANTSYTRCAFTGTITAKVAAGGIVGKIGQSHKLTECVSAGTITTETAGASGAFAVLDQRIYTGEVDRLSYSTWNGEKTLTLIDCYQIGDMDSLGYAMENGEVQGTYIGGHRVTVKYGTAGEIKYQSVLGENIPLLRSFAQKAADAKALIALSVFENWTADADGNVIPKGLAASMFAIRTVGLQITAPKDGVFSIRILAVIDNLVNFSKVGYEVDILRAEDGKTAHEKLETTTVFNEINAGGEIVTADSLYGKYISGLALKNMPATGTFTLSIRAFAVGIDGETVYYSEVVSVTVTDGAAS